jgi:hypothetical protein
VLAGTGEAFCALSSEMSAHCAEGTNDAFYGLSFCVENTLARCDEGYEREVVRCSPQTTCDKLAYEHCVEPDASAGD